MSGTKSQTEERFVKADPQSIQDALRLFFQPTKTGDLRTDFYSAYQKESAEYDTHFIKQYDEDLNTTLIFAGLFSAVCSAFVIDVQGKLEPDPVDASAAYLEAILNTLQNPGSTGGSTALPTWTGPSPTDVTVSVLLYTSLSTSLLAAFLAMLGKQWLNRYARRQGGSAAEKCEDRQRKLNGLQKWPFRVVIESLPVLLQVSLLLLGSALSRFLWDVNRLVASIVTGFTAYGISFYICIVIAGTLSYECPFQTPISLILRSLGINVLAGKFFSLFSQKLRGSNPDADCVFWTLDLITDPEVTTAALRHLTNIRWHYNPSEKVPLPQVARIYLKCFDSGHRILTESRDMAYAAGRALLQLYVHRLCSNMDSDCTHQAVTEAFDHLSSGSHDGQLQPLSLIIRNIREPDWSVDCPWEMTKFDLLWISDVWMYYAWFCRTRSKEAAPGSVIVDRNILVAISKLFENEESPPPRVVRNILQGLLTGVSSSVPPLDDLINPKLDGSISQLLRRLEDELMEFVDRKPWVLQATLQPLVSWKHNRMEVVVLCCNLLKAVMEKHTSKVALARQLVYLLCRIAFRHRMAGVKARADLMNPEMLKKLTSFVRDGDAEFINDLTSAFASISWDELQQGHIIWTTLDIPTTSLSPTSQSALITLFATARRSLVERLDRKKLTDFVGRLPIDMIVERMIEDESVCMGWLRLLLFSTFRSPYQPDAPRALWRVLLSAFPKVPRFFSHDLWDHLELSETSLSDLYQNHGDSLPISKEEEEEKKESLWMKLFWSSRFFELDCKSWFVFEDATVRLGQQREPLLAQLEKLCFSREKGPKDSSDVPRARTRARMKMGKVRQRVSSIKAEKIDPKRVAPKDTGPTNKPLQPPGDETSPNQPTQPSKVAPQDTPQFSPATRRQNTMMSIQIDLPQDPPSQQLPPPPPVQQTHPPSAPDIRERAESPTQTESDPPTKSTGVASQSNLAGAIHAASPSVGNEIGEHPSTLSFWMGCREEGYFD